MVNDRKIYDIKIYNDELSTVVAIILDKIRDLRIEIENQQDEVQRSRIQSNINKYLMIVARLNTGAMYNDNFEEKDSINS